MMLEQRVRQRTILKSTGRETERERERERDSTSIIILIIIERLLIILVHHM
jgi:hypothetical protein